MKGLKIFILILLLILVAVGGFFHQFGLMAEYVFLKSSYYERLLEDTALVEILYAEMKSSLAEEMMVEGSDPLALAMVEAVYDVFTEAWMKEQAMVLVDDMLLFVRGDKATLDAEIDLKTKKDELTARLETMIKALPDQALLQHGITPGSERLFAAMVVEDIDLPDKLLARDIFSDQSDWEAFRSYAEDVKQFRLVFVLLPFIAGALILVINCLLAGAGGGFKWFGSSILMSGLGFLLIMILSRAAAVVALSESMATDDLAATQAVVSAFEYTASRVISIPAYYSLAGLILILIGFLLGAILRKKQPPQGQHYQGYQGQQYYSQQPGQNYRG